MYVSYPFFCDQMHSDTDATWDSVDLNTLQFAVADAMPSAPSRHKSRRTPQRYASWITGKAGSGSNVLSSQGCSLAVSAPAQGNYDNDSDDLASMVHDFIENDSPGFPNEDDSDSGSPGVTKLGDNLQALTSSYGGIEAELLNVVRRLVLGIDIDTDLICNSEGTNCRGGCIKRLVVKQLRAAGFDAAICKAKWEGNGCVLRGTLHMGEYEYIDVEGSGERLIVDVDFQEQFVLARATPDYLTTLKLLPTVLVGTTERLEQILPIMSEAVKTSLNQNSMPLPPWRTLDFMSSKWLSPHERVIDRSWPCVPRGSLSVSLKGRLAPMLESRPCDVHLRRIKDSLLSEVNGSAMNILGRDRTRQYSKSRAKRSIL